MKSRSSFKMQKDEKTLNFNILQFFPLQLHNARLKGRQRKTTTLKHNSRNLKYPSKPKMASVGCPY
ncbi:hypothetical protein EXA23_16910 [Vibrio cincinnatiensis]|nr:hypothetical protein [Vibrio cincinnatiensis]